MTDLLLFIGYVLIFAAVHYGRKEDSKIPIISWDSLVVFSLILLGSLLVRVGHSKDKIKQRIEVQTEKPVSQQQTSYKL